MKIIEEFSKGVKKSKLAMNVALLLVLKWDLKIRITNVQNLRTQFNKVINVQFARKYSQGK